MAKQKSERVLVAREQSMRATLGLDAAQAGDETGVRKFARFMAGEALSLQFSPLATPIKLRIASVERELRELGVFMDGRLSVQQQKK